MERDFDGLVRQGDVTLVPVKGVEPKGEARASKAGLVILLEGEATGHHHSLVADKAEVIDAAEGIFVRIMEVVELTHQEHGAVTLAPGLYELRLDMDYVPGELPRRVLD